MSRLRPNPRIRVSRVIATDRPRHLQGQKFREKRVPSDMGSLFQNGSRPLELVEYKVAFPTSRIKAGTGNENIATFQRQDFEYAESVKRKHRHTRLTEVKSEQKLAQLVPSPVLVDNIEGRNALQCLQHLVDAKVLASIEWELTMPSKLPLTFATIHSDIYEGMKLVVDIDTSENKNQLIFVENRHLSQTSRKMLKQHLAAKALDRILGPQWPHRTLKEMNLSLGEVLVLSHDNTQSLKENRGGVNVENRSALQCLQQLKDVRLVDFEWEFVPFLNESPILEKIKLSVRKGSQTVASTIPIDCAVGGITFEQGRSSQESRNAVRTALSHLALHHVIGPEWHMLTLRQMKDHISPKC